MSNLKELKIAVTLAGEKYNEQLKIHLKTLEPYKRAYIKAIDAYDKALDQAIEDNDIAIEKRKKNKIKIK